MARRRNLVAISPRLDPALLLGSSRDARCWSNSAVCFTENFAAQRTHESWPSELS